MNRQEHAVVSAGSRRTDRLARKIRLHVQRTVGPIQGLWEGSRASGRVDLLWVRPRPERPCNTLVTCGLSRRPMNPPQEAKRNRFIELMISLPASWPIDTERVCRPGYGWPAELLSDLIVLLQGPPTWIWGGHTFGTEPPEPYAEHTKLCAAILACPVTLPQAHYLRLGPHRQIGFFNVIPLYEEELRLTHSEGPASILDRFAVAGITEIVRVDRPNVALEDRNASLH